MRKTNHVPWLGRTVVAVIMVLVGLGVFAGSAAAQTTVYDYDNYRAWWDSFGCPEMKVLLPALASGVRGLTSAETTAAHEKRVCVGSGAVKLEDAQILRDFIEGTSHAMKATHKSWWDSNSLADNACSLTQQALAGQVPIATDQGALIADFSGTASSDGMDEDYCGAYDRLRANAMARVTKSGDALSGRAMMSDDDDDDMDEAPALPLVGVGLLGLLLAGRGAWLRRRA